MVFFKTNGKAKEIDLTKLRGKIKVEVEEHKGKKGGEYYSLKAKFEDGVLKLEIPKKEAKPEVKEAKYISIA